MPNLAFIADTFQLEEETASFLQDLSVEELCSFVSVREDVTDEGLNKAASYAYFLLFQETGTTSYLRNGIEVAEEWLALSPSNNSKQVCPYRIRDMMRKQLDEANRVAEQSRRNNITSQRSRVRPPHFLDQEIETLEKQIFVTPSFIRGPYLSNLGNFLGERFNDTDWVEDLDNAIKYTQMAVDIPADDSTLSLRLTNFGGLHGTRFNRLGHTNDLDRAIELTKTAIALQPQDPASLARSFTGLETWISLRFERFGNDNDLGEAIEAAEMAVALTPNNDPDLHGRLNDLSNRLSDRFDHHGSEEDINKSIAYLEKALNWEGVLSNRDKGIYLNNLGLRLHSRFINNPSMNDLNEAIQVTEKAVAIGLSDGHTSLSSFLNTMAILYNERFKQRGELKDLDGAIEQAGMAVERSPRDHPDIIIRIMNWGSWLRSRAEQTGSLDDVDRSIEVMQPALDSLPTDHVSRAALLNELSCSYSTRYDRSLLLTDIEKGLKVAKEAFEFEPRDRLRWTSILNNYANLLGNYARVTGSADCLAEAIKNMRLAIQDTPVGHSYLPSRLCNLGDLLGSQFRETGSSDDLNDAIAATEKALNILPPEYHSRAQYIINLGTWLTKRWNMSGNPDDQRRALALYEEGSKLKAAAPYVRVMLARRAAEIHASSLAWEESSRFLEKAVDLLPAVSLRSLQHTDKQNMLGNFFGLASDAAAVSLSAGHSVYHALQLLERGRGVIAGLLMDMRGDISDLERDHPDLSNEFVTLREKLASQGDVSDSLTSIDHVASWDAQVRQRRTAEQDLDELIKNIRNQPNFQDFLRLPCEEELLKAARPGPIVIINTSCYRCDGFLIQHDRLSVLKLPGLTVRGVEEQVTKLRSLRGTNHVGMKALLNWLWDNITGPCLDALGCNGSASTSDLPRIWWIPTGLLSQLPLHAAGNYRVQPFDSVLDRTMSSYALSVKSLIHGRSIPSPEVAKVLNRSVLISMKHTPGLAHGGDLDFAEDEVSMLKDMCTPLGPTPVTPKPFKDDVLQYLKTCTVFHFAGHGSSDQIEPSKSCLLLEDWQDNPLTVGDFRDHQLHENPPFLGYLSACSTGANAVVKLADEGIHLISSLQLAGFRHVVGTLWEVSDRHCVTIARVFYETLQTEGMTDIGVCTALHTAVKELRDGKGSDGDRSRWAFCLDDGGSSVAPEGLENFHWVPYVHFGG